MTRRIRPLLVATVALAAVLLSRPALAGPPLLCFPFDIGAARSLPMGHGDWHDDRPDVRRVAARARHARAAGAGHAGDGRMETIRRATIYAAAHPKLATALFDELQARAAAPQPGVAALSVFDFGYLVESYKEAKFLFKEPLTAIDRIDGYQLVLKAHALQNDAAMQQAATLIVDGYPRGTK